MSATVSTATAVESASTMEASTTVDCAAAVEACAAMNYSAPGVSSSITASVTANVAASITPAWATPTSMPPIPRPTVVSAVAPAPVVPRADTDKHSANEPLRTVEAVRCAGIRIIGIVPVRTCRRPGSVSWAGVCLIGITSVRIPLIGWALISLALIGVTAIGLTLVVALIVSGRNSRINLRLRIRKRQHQHCQRRQIFHVAHIEPPRLQSHNFLSALDTFYGLVLGCLSPPTTNQNHYLFERGTPRKVAGTRVVHFSHLG